MKLSCIVFLAVCLLAVPAAFAGSFTNGGFEDGTFNGWTQGAGWWRGEWPIVPINYLPGGQYYDISYNASGIVTPGPDPIVGNLLNQVYNGKYAARVNDWSQNYSVSVISQSVTNYSESHIYFAWAAVLEASHGATDSDNFTLMLTDDTAQTVLYAVTYDSYNNGALFHPYGYWFYTDWQVQDLAVTPGHDFTLTLLGSDCPYGGHAGYVYLDGFGGTPPPPSTPEPGTLAMMGSGLLLGAGWLRNRFF